LRACRAELDELNIPHSWSMIAAIRVISDESTSLFSQLWCLRLQKRRCSLLQLQSCSLPSIVAKDVSLVDGHKPGEGSLHFVIETLRYSAVSHQSVILLAVCEMRSYSPLEIEASEQSAGPTDGKCHLDRPDSPILPRVCGRAWRPCILSQNPEPIAPACQPDPSQYLILLVS
jgi:hypothetical protein